MFAKNTLKITIPNSNVSLIKFKVPDKDYEELIDGNNFISVVGTCAINTWDNSPQILIEDYEITKKLAYLF